MVFHSRCDMSQIAIDLTESMIVDSVYLAGEIIDFSRKKDKILVKSDFSFNDIFEVIVFYRGKPVISKNLPWEGGFVWENKLDSSTQVGVACQMDGASIWWPNKDDLSDEVDSMRMSFIVEKPYSVISNGQLEGVRDLGMRKQFDWFVENPINNYNITINVAEYEHFKHSFSGLGGDLNIDYHVLPMNVELAKVHFKQVDSVLRFLEKKFGPYPFYGDGYKLVETSYLGMEHQSCISYGNRYKKGYLGYFPSDIDFDFIIFHETAHEWWGNSVSMKDRSDMWIHESFATYSEVLYTEEIYGYQKMLIYLDVQKQKILNKEPIVTNNPTTTDIYYKGSWMIHTLRTIFQNDTLWENLMRGLQLEFKHDVVNTSDIIQYIQTYIDYDLTYFFQQYLYETELPILNYFISKKGKQYFLNFRWDAISGFDMPILVSSDKKNYQWIYPNNIWRKVDLDLIDLNDFKIADHLFLFDLLKVE